VHLKFPVLFATAIVAALLSAPSPAAAQAFTPPAGVGEVTVAWQFVDNTGHRFSDGLFVARGQSVTTSALVELDYGFTDRLSTSIGIPYVFAKYTGASPPISGLPIDTCRCWNSAFQDLALSARYRLGDDTWAVTPVVRYDRPSHNYSYVGEAVVGRNLQEAQVGVTAGLKLASILPKASVQVGYTYAFVEKPLDEIKIDRSNGAFEFGYALHRRLYVSGTANWQRTHGGLRAGFLGDGTIPMNGELNTPERFAQRDRVIRTNYWHAGGGLSYSAGPVDLFVSITKYVSGTDTHNGQAYTVGTTWYFDVSK
jgi:hypothetical protein